MLAVNAKYVHSSLSVWVIAEGIERYALSAHDVFVVEATINQPVSEIVESVKAHEPDFIGISSYIWSAGMLPKLLLSLRKYLPDAVLVLGGPEASNNAEFWLEHGADFVLQGEGEYSFPQFLDKLVDGYPVEHDSPIDPYTNEYLSALNGRLSYIETSRGCPFQCSFCLSAGSDVRYFPLDIVKAQIIKLSKSNTKTIKFVDRTFNCNTERACELLEFVLSLDTACTFHFEVAADLFNERMLGLLKKAPSGRIQFEIGLQSFFEPALKAASRKMDTQKAEQNIRALLDMKNIHIHVDLIAGLPYETLADFMVSFDRTYMLNTHTLQLGFLKLLHGSALREQAEDYGIQYSSDPPYEITSNSWLSCDDLLILKRAENALQHTRNKGRFLSTLDYVLGVTGERPFSLLHSIGSAIPNHGTQLEDYAVYLYGFFATKPGVDSSALIDHMIYDWLGMVKGKNAPAFMKNNDSRRAKVAAEGEKLLGRTLKREEYAVLFSGTGIFVDSNTLDPVTGLYQVHSCQ